MGIALCGSVAAPFAQDRGDAPLDFSRAPRDVLPWGSLAKVAVHRAGDRLVPQFLPPVLALDRTSVTLYGYMTPVDGPGRTRRFLMSWRPIFCPGCEQPLGPEGIVEVNTRLPVAQTTEAFAVRGTLHVLRDDPLNVLYRLTDARIVAKREPPLPVSGLASGHRSGQRRDDGSRGPR